MTNELTQRPGSSSGQLAPFTGGKPSAITQVESSRAIQEVQASLVIAKNFPRDQIAALERIKNACSRPSLANVAVYQYARGGTDITGPSIRLAEAIAQQWGNLTFGFTELEQANGVSTCEAYCWDLETNTKRSVTFQVPHVRYSKSKGNTPLSDPRDIYELVANNASRRVRSCILATIPGDVVEAALEQCDETMRADADTSPDAQRKILDVFAKFGVTKDQIEKRIQRKLDAIQPAQVVALRKIVASLKDGMSKPSEWFEAAVSAATVPVVAPEPEPTPKKRKPKQETAKAEEGFTLDASEPTPREILAARMNEAGVTWEQIAQVAEAGGLFVDANAALEDQPEDVLSDILSVWGNLLEMVKGGAK